LNIEIQRISREEYKEKVWSMQILQMAKRKVIQVAFKTLFRLHREKPDKTFVIKIGSINEQKKNKFKSWFEVKS